ncbi:T9SS type A sorting domain-containing protein [Paucihalobacter sp.]|uniref:T9SS type A sorting domain-containing protein n=1 Tax=Paucihalobacter sp. TaxID=2850405 RepID=UPI002FE0DDC1
MKKITFFLLSLTTVFSFAQNGGDTCASAVAVTPGSFTGTTITQGVSGATAAGFDAAWFAFTPDEDGTIDVSSCLGGADTRLWIRTGTCGSLNLVAQSDDVCAFNPDGTGSLWAAEITEFAVSAGVTYFIEWDDRWSTASFDWSLSFNAPPACSEVNAIFADILLGDQLDFSWTPADFGPPVGYNWEIVADGAGQGNSIVVSGNTAGTNASSGSVLTLNTPYDLFIQTDCGGGVTSAWVGPINFTTLSFTPVVNDLCAGALPVSVQGDVATAAAAVYEPGSVADTANTDIFGLACNGFTGNALDDVWFSFVAGSENVNITADTNFDAVLTLFSGDCDNLIQLDCADDDGAGAGGIEEINATGLTIGDTYYFRVYFFGTNPMNSTFEFAVWTPQTLSNEDVLANTNFSYFPNPVKNTLILKAQNSIENVTVFNMLGQAVIKTTPNAMESEIDMQSLNTGTYFAQVTINNVTKTIKLLKQ